MGKFVCAARTPVVLLGGLVAIQGSYLVQKYLDVARSVGASDSILYGSNSPFQDAAFLRVAVGAGATVDAGGVPSGIPPRTDGALRTPVTPFGAGELSEYADGVSEFTVQAGETFGALWQRLGGGRDTVASAVKAFTDAQVVRKGLVAGEKVQVTRKGGEIVELRRNLGEGASLVLCGTEDGYAPRVEQARILERERKVTGTITSSLVSTAQGLSIPYSLVDDLVDLFSSRIEFRRDLHPGDTFSVVYDERVSEQGEQLTPGVIKAASLKLNGKMYAVVRDVTREGVVRYFDEKGEMPGKFLLRYPLKFSRISSVFATARFHPVLNVSRPHNGVDFSAPTGTPVRTVGDGTVIFAGFKSSTGNMVRIAHNSRYTTEYMHLSKIAPEIKTGARVARGSVIGAVGQTGLATGPHLHFGMYDKGAYIDPLQSNQMQMEEEVKPPVAVLAMLEELKKSHEVTTLAAIASDKRA